ncbi:hypothetical protein Bhyg_04288 [Pseudolycoriella hygida]|uniref:Uncharacterized protein n=1 Tax=Pseudolycoriella hygida TaxID=35572 RepID=A0A9Q0S9Z3_9DIPT|nr:hypothetical protein Bhyg_04288 [Pseudolycoriella hygida]
MKSAVLNINVDKENDFLESESESNPKTLENRRAQNAITQECTGTRAQNHTTINTRKGSQP